jgi:hypothetical protein
LVDVSGVTDVLSRNMQATTRPSIFLTSSTESLRSTFALAHALEFDAEVRVWRPAVFAPTAPILQAVTAQIAEADYFIVVLTDDDIVSGPERRARPNVIFELGLAVGRLGPERVMVVRDGAVLLPTDLAGLTVITGDLEDPATVAQIAKTINRELGELGRRSRPAKEGVTVFISYAIEDVAFAKRLAGDITLAGFSCWLEHDSLVPGQPWAARLPTAFSSSERVVAILSRASAHSEFAWADLAVAASAETGARREVLFPVAIDSSVLSAHINWPGDLRPEEFADFTHWESDDANYQHALRRLLQDLSLSVDRSARA